MEKRAILQRIVVREMAKGECLCRRLSQIQSKLKALPFVHVNVGGRNFKALVDTGCSKSIIASWVKPGQVGKCGGSVITVNGKEVKSIGETKITIRIQLDISVVIDCVVMEEFLVLTWFLAWM